MDEIVLPVIDGRQVDAPERTQFDFWVGSWRVRQLAGAEVDGSNEVGWTLDGAVLWEQFSAGPDPFTGWSFSVPVSAVAGCRPGWTTPARIWTSLVAGGRPDGP